MQYKDVQVVIVRSEYGVIKWYRKSGNIVGECPAWLPERCHLTRTTSHSAQAILRYKGRAVGLIAFWLMVAKDNVELGRKFYVEEFARLLITKADRLAGRAYFSTLGAPAIYIMRQERPSQEEGELEEVECG